MIVGARPEESIFECVANISEGRDLGIIGRLEAACAGTLIDRHSDRHHHRSVFTLAGTLEEVQDSARALSTAAVELLDLTAHRGVHPRFGVVDVVPFVPVADGELDLTAVVAARDRFARWLAAEHGVPTFLYGPLREGHERTLPEVRRSAFTALQPDFGPQAPHPTAGACAVGARGPLIAYNLWLDDGDPEIARHIAAAIRGPSVRALGFDIDGVGQVSCNLIDPFTVGPAEIFDEVARRLRVEHRSIARAELVGLVPARVISAIPPQRWSELGLDPNASIEARLARNASVRTQRLRP